MTHPEKTFWTLIICNQFLLPKIRQRSTEKNISWNCKHQQQHLYDFDLQESGREQVVDFEEEQVQPSAIRVQKVSNLQAEGASAR